tara:strand:- start:1195 stop:1407 length:213 start_codon:yes stop_codon:yes gene_type:complete
MLHFLKDIDLADLTGQLQKQARTTLLQPMKPIQVLCAVIKQQLTRTQMVSLVIVCLMPSGQILSRIWRLV